MSMSMSKWSLAASLTLLLAGCSAYSVVPPSRQVVQGQLSIETGARWNRVAQRTPESMFYSSSGPVEVWTVDGESLDSVVFFAGIFDGAPLIVLPGDKPALAPFHASMTPSEVMDLVEAMLARVSNTTVTKTHDLRPVQFAGADGFRFEISYSERDDIDRELAAVGAVRNKKLYLVIFQGTKLYHYGKYLPEFERIVQSMSFAGT
jgi:hypothetical protein